MSSPGRTDLDQELDDCLVGPVPVGVNSFEFQGAPPDKSVIPADDVLGVAALILTGSYNDQEFVRIGYYQNTEYDNPEMRESPPAHIVFDHLTRELNDKPRVTRFHIKWCVRRLRIGVVLMHARAGTAARPSRPRPRCQLRQRPSRTAPTSPPHPPRYHRPTFCNSSIVLVLYFLRFVLPGCMKLCADHFAPSDDVQDTTYPP